MLKGILLTCFFISFFTSASNKDVKSEFTSTYNAYKEAVKLKDKTSRLQLAKKSYLLGCDYYGENNVNCASLILNYAYEVNDDKSLINSLLEKALAINIKEYGENSIELFDIYYRIANRNVGYKNKKSIFASKKALNIAEAIYETTPVISAHIKLKTGDVLLRNQHKLSKVILEANSELEELLEEDDIRLIKSRFLAAKYLQAKGKPKRSIIPLEKNINAFNKTAGATHPYELISRAFLIRAYESIDESDKATEHCIAIGSMTPWDANQNPTPIYRVNPTYPLKAIKNNEEGWVKIEFIIDKNGIVKEPNVIETSGKKTFIKESIYALKKWRYAPKFENGHAVDVKSSVQLDFNIGNSSTMHVFSN